MPKPYPKGSNLDLKMGDAAEGRMGHALLAASVISQYAHVEAGVRLIYLAMLGKNPGPAAASFTSLRNARAQHDALMAVAKTVLSPGDLAILEAFWKLYVSVGTERNALAHGLWAVDPSQRDALVVVELQGMVQFTALQQQYLDAGELGLKQGEASIDLLRKAARLWTIQDLDRLRSRMVSAKQAALTLPLAIAPQTDPAEADKARAILTSMKELQAFLPEAMHTERPVTKATSQRRAGSPRRAQ